MSKKSNSSKSGKNEDQSELEIDLKEAVSHLKQMFPKTEDDVILSTLMKSGNSSPPFSIF